jgi:opacity protein-like surface antigen
MRLKSLVVSFVFLLVVGGASHSRAQVTYSAREGKLPFTVGLGISDFSDDWGVHNPRQVGITLWADWRLPHLPHALDGLGLELEGRDINYATPASIPGHRMDTALSGPTYQFRRQSSIRPFVKYLMGIGSIDFPNGSTYSHDTRTVFAPSGGVDLRFRNQYSVRAEYEYQIWHIFSDNLTPNGVSVGVVYDFGRRPGA